MKLMMNARRLERLMILAVALHSMIVGVILLTRPVEMLNAVGWEYEGSVFFPNQAGIFHIVLGAVYLTAIWHRVLAWLLVGAKTLAFVFLLTEYAIGNGPVVLIAIGVTDGLMGVAVAALMLWNARSNK
jgi:hypothetical protein